MSAGRRTVAVVGLGGMGGGLARRLLSQGFPIVVYNRDAAKTGPLAEAGAAVASSLGEIARDAGMVILSLSDERAVLEVLEGGLVAGLSPGTLVLDATTVSPEFAAEISERLGARGILRVEICVVGNPAMAASGELRVFTAGDISVVARAEPVLSAISRHLSHVGGPGAATTLKLAFNILLGAQVTALAEAVALGESAGMDRDVLLDEITGSGFSSAVLAFRAEFMRKRSYTPAAFRAQLMEKDLRLACASAAKAGIELPIAERARSAFADAVAAGHGGSDVSVVLELATAACHDDESGGRLQ